MNHEVLIAGFLEQHGPQALLSLLSGWSHSWRVEVALTPEWLLGTMFNQQQPLLHVKFHPQCYVQSGHDPHNTNYSKLGLHQSGLHSSFRHEVGCPDTLRSGNFLRVIFLLGMIDLCWSVQFFLCLSRKMRPWTWVRSIVSDDPKS